VEHGGARSWKATTNDRPALRIRQRLLTSFVPCLNRRPSVRTWDETCGRWSACARAVENKHGVVSPSLDPADEFFTIVQTSTALATSQRTLCFIVVDQVGGCPRHLSLWDLLQEKISSLAEMTTMQTPQGRVIGHVSRPPRHQGGKTVPPGHPLSSGPSPAPCRWRTLVRPVVPTVQKKVQVGAHTRMLIPLLFDLLPRFFITHWFEVYRPIHIPFTSQPVTPFLIHHTFPREHQVESLADSTHTTVLPNDKFLDEKTATQTKRTNEQAQHSLS